MPETFPGIDSELAKGAEMTSSPLPERTPCQCVTPAMLRESELLNTEGLVQLEPPPPPTFDAELVRPPQ